MAMLLAYGFFRYCCRGKVLGRENVVRCRASGFIVAANHGSYLDWLVLGAFFHYVEPIHVYYLAKDRLFRGGLWGWIISEKDCLRVSDDGHAILDNRDLSMFQYLTVFPEGTRSRDGTIGRGHPGVVKLALKLGKPIIPVGLRGFYEAWPRHRKIPRRAVCSIVFGEPIEFGLPKGTILPDDLLRIQTDKLMAEIAELCRESA
jgi:1-acyl-sn-glycerol-3-phosphate acyltransferase